MEEGCSGGGARTFDAGHPGYLRDVAALCGGGGGRSGRKEPSEAAEGFAEAAAPSGEARTRQRHIKGEGLSAGRTLGERPRPVVPPVDHHRGNARRRGPPGEHPPQESLEAVARGVPPAIVALRGGEAGDGGVVRRWEGAESGAESGAEERGRVTHGKLEEDEVDLRVLWWVGGLGREEPSGQAGLRGAGRRPPSGAATVTRWSTPPGGTSGGGPRLLEGDLVLHAGGEEGGARGRNGAVDVFVARVGPAGGDEVEDEAGPARAGGREQAGGGGWRRAPTPSRTLTRSPESCFLVLGGQSLRGGCAPGGRA